MSWLTFIYWRSKPPEFSLRDIGPAFRWLTHRPSPRSFSFCIWVINTNPLDSKNINRNHHCRAWDVYTMATNALNSVGGEGGGKGAETWWRGTPTFWTCRWRTPPAPQTPWTAASAWQSHWGWRKLTSGARGKSKVVTGRQGVGVTLWQAWGAHTEAWCIPQCRVMCTQEVPHMAGHVGKSEPVSALRMPLTTCWRSAVEWFSSTDWKSRLLRSKGACPAYRLVVAGQVTSPSHAWGRELKIKSTCLIGFKRIKWTCM